MGASKGAAMTGLLQGSNLRPGESFLDALNRQLGTSPSAAGANSSTPSNTVLNTQNGTSPLTPAEELHAKARKAAEGLVSNALILPVLKQLRHDPFGKNTIFSPGTGEKTFGPEFDMQIADRIAQSPAMAATQVLTKRIERSQAAAVGTNKVEGLGVDVHG
jgi:hypothetical protein